MTNASDPLIANGTLHIAIALDWGEEIELSLASELLPAEPQSLPRRARTPASIVYRPLPLRFRLPQVVIEFAELGVVQCDVEATVFDFGAVNVAIRAPFSLSMPQLRRVAASLSQSEIIKTRAKESAKGLFEKLKPAIKNPAWSPLSEEYFVFHLTPGNGLPSPAELVSEHAAWLASLVRLEDGPLCEEEIGEAIRQRISYSPDDLVVVEWAAAVVIDRDCDETLQAMEFANLQLLEFRFIDLRVDDALAEAYGLIHPLARTWLPLWRTHARSLRVLGDMRIEADMLFERATNALKLVGDQYLSRVFRLLANRFHLEEWSKSIHNSLDVAERVFQVVSEQSAGYRVELLEGIVIVLILFEIIMAFWRH